VRESETVASESPRERCNCEPRIARMDACGTQNSPTARGIGGATHDSSLVCVHGVCVCTLGW
jgi:hypothetical protein